MPPEEYTYNPEDSQQVGSKNIPAYGIQVSSVNVGQAEEKEIYLDYSHNTTRNYNLDSLQKGNIVKVSYHKRRVKTPYRVAFLRIDEPTEDNYRDEGWMNRHFSIVLEPFNSRASTLILHGIKKYNSKKQFTEWTTSRKEDTHSTKELINWITSTENPVENMMRKIGEDVNDFRHIQIVSDISVAKLFEIKDPKLVPLTI
jgi:hypothetical protein